MRRTPAELLEALAGAIGELEGRVSALQAELGAVRDAADQLRARYRERLESLLQRIERQKAGKP